MLPEGEMVASYGRTDATMPPIAQIMLVWVNMLIHLLEHTAVT